MSITATITQTHLSSKDAIQLEHDYSAHNYHPIPIVFARASGAHVYDPEGKEYIDMLSAYSAVNQGHCHPRIVAALTEQASRLTLSSRAFYADKLGQFCKKLSSLLGYEMVLPMNTGAEAVETALKLSRKWAYQKKGVPEDKAIILSVTDNFHGRTLGVVSMSSDPDASREFGPFLPAVGARDESGKIDPSRVLRFGVVEDLENALKLYGKNTAAFLVEPIQGEAGIVVPPEDYLEKCQELCRKYNVLFICDEIQTGLGRTGKMLCSSYNPNVKPDIITLGKALSGGVYPVSAVLSSKEVMLCVKPGEHGSTYGGNPLACAVGTAALDVLIEENLCEKAEKLGNVFAQGLETLKETGLVSEVRGKGLLRAIVIDESKSKKGRGAWELCLLMASRGLLAKPTHGHIIRLAPPLVISEQEIKRSVEIIRSCINDLDSVEQIPLNDSH